ncbi:hypothetical protein EV188_104116 [Actinomycetospora succinea]|uniref:Sulfite exporter TauE/SafE n=1 Tax=Actinomycetospora succinea TaxID=663603 RepID=A0A4R6V9D4_9PSEU|nr:hypothetical protein EV188_104116 [Actinomycetospora succinea]
MDASGEHATDSPLGTVGAASIGLVGGAVSGLFGGGSGVLFVPASTASRAYPARWRTAPRPPPTSPSA